MCYAKLRRLQVALPLARTIKGTIPQQAMANIDAVWPWQFEAAFAPCTFGFELRDIQVGHVWVLRLVEHVSSSRMSSPTELVPFEDLMRDLPDPKVAIGSSDPRKQGSGTSASGTAATKASSSTDGQPAAEASRAEEEGGGKFDELNEDELVSLKEWLAKKQVEMQAARQLTSEYAVAKIRWHNGLQRRGESDQMLQWARRRMTWLPNGPPWSSARK